MFRTITAAGLALALTTAAAHSAPYSAEYVFGDSLSDTGNLAEAFYKQNLPNPPSFSDAFTNGPVAVKLLASSLGLPLTPSLWLTAFKDPYGLFGGPSFVPGTSYAVVGATSAAAAVGGLPGVNLPQQVAAFGGARSGVADPNALYVVMIGGNDVRNAAKQATGATAVTTGVQAELAAIQTLATEGAKNFLVVNVPNVGNIPEFRQDNPTIAGNATTYSQQYNAQLATGIAGLTLPAGTNLTQFDLYTYDNAIQANGAYYGLTNLTDRCFTNVPLSAAATPQCGPNGANVNTFAYWDAIHPTQPVQAAWAGGFEQALGVPVPEPSTVAILVMALLGLLTWGRGHPARSAQA